MIAVQLRDDPDQSVMHEILVRSDLLTEPMSERNDAAQMLTAQRVSELFGQAYEAACPRIPKG